MRPSHVRGAPYSARGSRLVVGLAVTGSLALFVACNPEHVTDVTPGSIVTTPSYARGGGSIFVVNVSDDTTAQNETPLAVNPANPLNLITGNNDWNYNDGCGVNASFDGGKTWTKTLPSGFIPGISRYTNDPTVPGTGVYDYAGDPAVAFSPDGSKAYFACFGYQGTPPYGVTLLLSRSTDGGLTWTAGGSAPLTLVSNFTGNGQAKGSTGQFPDHESIHVAKDGTIYIPWAQFTGFSGHSPIYVSTSTDGGASFSTPVKVTSGSVHSDQDARLVTDPATGLRLSHLRQLGARRQGHGDVRQRLQGSRRHMEHSGALRHLRESGLPLSPLLLQHLGQPVPRARLVPGAGVRSDDRPAVRGLHRHRRRTGADLPDVRERQRSGAVDGATGGGARLR
ncbi:MAG TPA: sialidase family protein [Gemmatimonadaceae bacterium]|nr:sialidase family protein [Gemmatimonadaceae bacterium]